MKLEEIKWAVKEGIPVYYQTTAYEVKLHHYASGEDNWLITCNLNNHSIGLTWADGITMNGKQEHFYVIK